ncbi:hypothetical protein BGZ83_006922 [Gryganskiella cystojenkinii]|nr:hypothetical protein BGZ83_006922 [Gryganskiella cystojenkinii]
MDSVAQADALPRLSTNDVTGLFQLLNQSIQSEEAMEMMLQIALDVSTIGKQLPQEAYEILLNQAIDHMPVDQIKSTLTQIQGRRRFITNMMQLCESNAEMKELTRLYHTLTQASFDVDGYSSYYHERRQLASELSKLTLQWISSEGDRLRPRLTEELLVFLLDRGALDEVYTAVAKMSKEGHVFARSFFTQAIHRFGRAKKFDSMDMTLDLMRKQGLEPVEETYTAIIDAHSKAGNLREAQRAYQDILAAGLVPSEKTFGPMLEAVGKMGDFEMTKQLVEHMNASGVASNRYTLNALLQSLSHDPALSTELFQEMSQQIEPGVVNYNMLIRTYQQNADLDGAFKVFRSMISKGVKPDRYTFASILNLFATRGDAGGAEVFWNEMVDEHGVTPNVVAYGAMIHAYCTADDMISAQAIYRQMIQAGIMPNHTIFGTLLGAYARSGDLTQMLSIYDAMRAEGLVANSYIYANLLFGLIKDGDMVAARRLFENMEEEGFGNNVLAHTILMKGYLDQGQVKESQEVYRNMVATGLIPNFETYAVMLHGHARRGEKKEGHALLNRIMKSQGLVVPRTKDQLGDIEIPPTVLEGEEDDLLSRAHEGQFSSIGTERKPLKVGAKPNAIYTFTPLLDSYAKEANLLAAKGMFNEIKDRGFEPNTVTYTILMDGYRRANDVDSVLNIWHELFERILKQWQTAQKELVKGGPRERSTELLRDRLSTRALKLRRLLQHPISITMDTLGYSGRIQEVKSMWNRLERIGFEFDSANWNDYVIALARNGQLTDACAVFQEKLLPGLNINREADSDERGTEEDALSSSTAHILTGSSPGFQGQYNRRVGIDISPSSTTDSAKVTGSVFRKPSSLLYPRPRTMAALADTLEDLLSFENRQSGKFKIDADLSDPFTKEELALQKDSFAFRSKKLYQRKKTIEASLQSYPRPFDGLEESDRKFLWTWIRAEFPKVLEVLNEGMLVSAESVKHLNKHGSTLPIWSTQISDVSDDRDKPSTSKTTVKPDSLGMKEEEEAAAKPQVVEFKGFRPWRNLKAAIKDMERRQYLEERTQTIKEREERFDLLRGRKPKAYN